MVETRDEHEGTHCPVADTRDDHLKTNYALLGTADARDGTRCPMVGTPAEHGRTGCPLVGDGVGLEEDLAAEDTTRGPSHAGLERLAVVRDDEVAPG